jgi:glutamyl-tRNA synthetase
MTVVTRFAPSPTGLLNIGGVRTALFSWVYARHSGGRFLLRVEDTDRERSREAAVRVILDGMRWLGLEYDGEVKYQTRRYDRYRAVVEQMLAAGQAYYCYCSKDELEAMRFAQLAERQKPRYDGRCRSRTAPAQGVEPVIRFRNPDAGEVVVEDVVHGPVTFRNVDLDDLIIVRSDGNPTYNFRVVVDDMDMGITHVVRGDDHLNNTPRQINMLRALGAKVPVYAHVPMILGADGAKLSKRHGAVNVLQYEEEGYLPDALLNYLVRLDWSHGDQEVFTREEMIAAFDIRDINKAASAFNAEKLVWLNQQHMMQAPVTALAAGLQAQLTRLGIRCENRALLEGVADAQRERAKTLKEMARNSLFFFREVETYDEKAAKKYLGPDAVPLLEALQAVFAAIPEWDAPAIDEAVKAVATRFGVGLGKVAQPLRVAVTGGGVTAH